MAAEKRLPLFAFCSLLLCSLSVGRAVAQYSSDISFRARGGMSYLQDVSDSQLGALYGFDMAVPLFDQASVYGSFTHNHFEQGSQYLGTVGSIRQGLGDGDMLQSLSGGVLFDQYTDTRFDGLYLSQFRFFTGYAFSEQMAAGVTYTNPIEDADSVVVSLPGGGTGPAVLQNAELVEAYLSLSWENHLVTATVGQRQDPNALVGSLYAARVLNPNLLLYTNTSYAEDSLWAITCGLQWAFGGPTPRRQPGLLAANYTDATTVVRGQNSLGRMNPYVDTSLGHNLNLDPQRFAAMITSDVSLIVFTVPTPGTNDPGTNGTTEEPLGRDEFIIPDWSGPEESGGTVTTNPTGNDDQSSPPLGYDQTIIPNWFDE